MIGTVLIVLAAVFVGWPAAVFLFGFALTKTFKSASGDAELAGLAIAGAPYLVLFWLWLQVKQAWKDSKDI